MRDTSWVLRKRSVNGVTRMDRRRSEEVRRKVSVREKLSDRVVQTYEAYEWGTIDSKECTSSR